MVLDKVLDDSGGVSGRGKQVQIAVGIEPPAVAARDDKLLHRAACLQVAHQGFGAWFGDDKPVASMALQARIGGLQQAQLALRAKAGQFSNLMRGRRPGQFIQCGNPQFVLQHAGPLRAEPRQLKELHHGLRDLSTYPDEHGAGACFNNLPHLCRKVGTDTGQFGQICPVRQHHVNAFRHALNDARGIAVGAHTKGVGLLNLKEIGDFVEDRRDGLVAHVWR